MTGLAHAVTALVLVVSLWVVLHDRAGVFDQSRWLVVGVTSIPTIAALLATVIRPWARRHHGLWLSALAAAASGVVAGTATGFPFAVSWVETNNVHSQEAAGGVVAGIVSFTATLGFCLAIAGEVAVRLCERWPRLASVSYRLPVVSPHALLGMLWGAVGGVYGGRLLPTLPSSVFSHDDVVVGVAFSAVFAFVITYKSLDPVRPQRLLCAATATTVITLWLLFGAAVAGAVDLRLPALAWEQLPQAVLALSACLGLFLGLSAAHAQGVVQAYLTKRDSGTRRRTLVVAILFVAGAVACVQAQGPAALSRLGRLEETRLLKELPHTGMAVCPDADCVVLVNPMHGYEGTSRGEAESAVRGFRLSNGEHKWGTIVRCAEGRTPLVGYSQELRVATLQEGVGPDEVSRRTVTTYDPATGRVITETASSSNADFEVDTSLALDTSVFQLPPRGWRGFSFLPFQPGSRHLAIIDWSSNVQYRRLSGKIALSPSGKRFVLLQERRVTVRTVSNGAIDILPFSGVTLAAFVADDRLVLEQPGMLTLVDLSDGAKVLQSSGCAPGSTTMLIRGSSRFALVRPEALLLFDTESLRLLQTLPMSGPARVGAFSRDDELLVVVDAIGRGNWWRAPFTLPPRVIPFEIDKVVAIDVSPGGRFLAWGGANGVVAVTQPDSSRRDEPPLLLLPGSGDGGVERIKLSDDGLIEVRYASSRSAFWSLGERRSASGPTTSFAEPSVPTRPTSGAVAPGGESPLIDFEGPLKTELDRWLSARVNGGPPGDDPIAEYLTSLRFTPQAPLDRVRGRALVVATFNVAGPMLVDVRLPLPLWVPYLLAVVAILGPLRVARLAGRLVTSRAVALDAERNRSLVESYLALTEARVRRLGRSELSIEGLPGWLADRTGIPVFIRTRLEESDLEGLQQLARDHQAAERPMAAFVFYSERPDPRVRLDVVDHRVRQNLIVILIALSTVERAVRNKEDATNSLFRVVEEQRPTFDPFAYTDAIADSLSFYGRAAFLALLEQDVPARQAIGLFGLRKAGKTSVLNELAHRMPGYVVMVITLQGDAGTPRLATQVFNRILLHGKEVITARAALLGADVAASDWDDLQLLDASLDGETSAPSFRSRVTHLAARLKELGFKDPPIIVCLDEVNVILPRRQAPERVSEFNALFHELRALSGNAPRGPLSLVIADVHPEINRLNEWPDGRENPVFQYFDVRYVGPLAPGETEDMIRDLARIADVKFEDGALRVIAEASGGHPAYARFLARWMCELRPRVEGKPASREVSTELASAVSDGLLDSPRAYDDLSGRVEEGIIGVIASRDPLGVTRAILDCIACSPSGVSTPELISRAAARATSPAPAGEVKKALGWLENLGLVRIDGALCRSGLPLFTRWLLLQLDDDQRAHWTAPT